MHRQAPHQGFSRSELLGGLAVFALLAAIFFPVFQKMHPSPNGAVCDAFGKPVPGAVLHFRDNTSRIVATVTTDSSGSFRRSGLNNLSRRPVDGFGLKRVSHQTGSGDLYTFFSAPDHNAWQ